MSSVQRSNVANLLDSKLRRDKKQISEFPGGCGGGGVGFIDFFSLAASPKLFFINCEGLKPINLAL